MFKYILTAEADKYPIGTKLYNNYTARQAFCQAALCKKHILLYGKKIKLVI